MGLIFNLIDNLRFFNRRRIYKRQQASRSRSALTGFYLVVCKHILMGPGSPV